MAEIVNVNLPMWVAFPLASTVANTKGGVSGVGDNPFQAAFERHLLSRDHGAGEAQYGRKPASQCEASSETESLHAFSPCGLR